MNPHSSPQCDALPTSGPRAAYPSDVTELQWRRLQPRIGPEVPRAGRPRTTELREIVSAMNYRWRTGCSWRMLPHDFPPWETVYTYYRKWSRNGLVLEIRAELQSIPDR